jgi:hypothetical protein
VLGAQASQRVRPDVAGPMTSSATPLFERLWPGMTQVVAAYFDGSVGDHSLIGEVFS